MSQHTIVLAGATGQLGRRILQNLLAKEHVTLKILVRSRSKLGNLANLEPLRGALVHEVDFRSTTALARACEGGNCVVSALGGLSEVIVDVQSRLLDAASAAQVPRFIPSDFSIDFSKIPSGWNRNLNLRSQFKDRIDKTRIQATSILNGAFTDMLNGQAPFILPAIHRILCWGDRDQKMDWTTIDDTAAYTAEAALDPAAPRYLRIAGDEVSANDLARIASAVRGKQFKVLRPGGTETLKTLISAIKALSPRSDDLYPAWQGMQYMHNMYSGIAKLDPLDNDRYTSVNWTSVEESLKSSRSILRRASGTS